MGQGDIDLLVGIADTIASPPGTITTRPLIPASWQVATPTLGTGSVASPPAEGGLESDGGAGVNPDLYVGSFALTSSAPTLGVGSIAGPAAKGDVGDVFGAPDLGMDAQVAGFAAFQQVAPTLGTGTVAAPPEHGDVGDTGGPTTLQGDTNDSNAGAGTLTSWSSGTITLGLGSIPQAREHGDIGEMYGLGEGPIGQVVWQIATPSLGTGTLTTPHGNGDITDPYAWQDVVLYLTSWTYPLTPADNNTQIPGATTGHMELALYRIPMENYTGGMALVSGHMDPSLIVYTFWPAENYSQTGMALNSGDMHLALIVYTFWPAENYTQGAMALSSGSLVVAAGYINYTNWPAENYTQGQMSLISGTLS